MMSVLTEKASKSFDKYIQQFFDGRGSVKLPKSRLTDAEWERLNLELAKHSVEMKPCSVDGRPYMEFGQISQKEKNRRLLQAGVISAMDNLVARFQQISGVSGWEYKATSGLKFEHIRLKIDGMSKAQIDKIIKTCKENSVNLEIMDINKGRFLYFNVENARNVAPNNYQPNNKIKYETYTNAGVGVSEFAKNQIKDILDIDYPNGETNTLSPTMQEQTKMILKKYAALGLVDLRKLRQFAQDIRDNLIAELADNERIAKKIIQWDSLTVADKKLLIKNLNYIVGSQRLDHSGKSILIMGPEEVHANGHFIKYWGEEKEFMFNDKLLAKPFDNCFGTIVHENVHRFQQEGASAIPLAVAQYMESIYERRPYKHYFNNLIECESRYVQAFVMRDFSRDFLAYYNKKKLYNIITPTGRGM